MGYTETDGVSHFPYVFLFFFSLFFSFASLVLFPFISSID